MTDRYYALSVVLRHDTRDDDAQAIIQAIQMVKGVLSVEPHVADMETWAAEARVKVELRQRLFEVLQDE